MSKEVFVAFGVDIDRPDARCRTCSLAVGARGRCEGPVCAARPSSLVTRPAEAIR